jgi:molybdopterin synthase sulfur carrier subunit
MDIKLLAFAQAQEAFGFREQIATCTPLDTPRSLILRIKPDADLAQLRVALDYEFTSWDTPLGNARELALIPPVSGG